MPTKREDFDSLLRELKVPESFNYGFLFTAFEYAMEGAASISQQNASFISNGINPLEVVFYLINEHSFYIKTHPNLNMDELIKNEQYLQMLASITLDKYFTNEHLNYKMGNLTSRFSPEMSTLDLYFNFILGMLSRYQHGNPRQTLIVDIMNKGFQIGKCVSSLLEGGYETEAFSTWRTLHENECILAIIVKYGPPVIEAYLKHMSYGIAFRGGIPSKEETDKIFLQIKSEMKVHDLKSKDIKKFIEYGWLLSVPGIENVSDFKLNFRDGVERVAELNTYSKVYEMSSEIAHSSPLLIYSRRGYFFYFTLLNLYESFFRLEKIFTSLYMSNVEEEQRKKYAEMRKLYYWEVVAAYNQIKENFKKYNEKKN
ncbi:MAG: DUF5677 domain-containing protein [Bacilli bacterium]|nr:DUF5677 domain-containing protein [Bacilli bacterium]MDY6430859.1 DUF5677 domain-containing protein [Bacilli bacterium]